ncbi:MAG: hypothetical protein ABS46_07885 [Cytophagaceae bacterium SCN 52-12]|nr:MAG: hypothetical protein ABS46_07885 [Cytophagaceae bacterium SCN 52-12]
MINSLEIDSVQLSFGARKILQSIYLKAKTGKVTGILGRNGSGKSSLMKLIFGELSAEMSLRLNGKALLSRYRNPSDMRMLPHYRLIPEDFRISRVFDDFEVDYTEFKACFGEFSKFGDLKIGQLSGGNVRVIEVYIILRSDARFCLLDEPFTYLSPKNVHLFTGLISEEKKRKGIIITDHLYRSVVQVSDDLYLLREGSMYKINDKHDLVRLGYLPEA